MKRITHVIAVGLATVAAFFMTPAGMALVHQYPRLAAVSTLVGMGALYFNPTKPAA